MPKIKHKPLAPKLGIVKRTFLMPSHFARVDAEHKASMISLPSEPWKRAAVTENQKESKMTA